MPKENRPHNLGQTCQSRGKEIHACGLKALGILHEHLELHSRHSIKHKVGVSISFHEMRCSSKSGKRGLEDKRVLPQIRIESCRPTWPAIVTTCWSGSIGLSS